MGGKQDSGEDRGLQENEQETRGAGEETLRTGDQVPGEVRRTEL